MGAATPASDPVPWLTTVLDDLGVVELLAVLGVAIWAAALVWLVAATVRHSRARRRHHHHHGGDDWSRLHPR